MLTVEQIEEGRRIIAAGQSYASWQDGADFFRDHGAELLDAAALGLRAPTCRSCSRPAELCEHCHDEGMAEATARQDW